MNAPSPDRATPTPAPARAPLMPLDEALERLLAQAVANLGVESVSTFDADGRVLAQDVVAQMTVPPLDNSAMDGYAVRSADCQAAGAVLPVSQRIAAGQVGQPLAPGTAARIFTGAPVPAGADAVVMQEDTEALDGGTQVRIRIAPAVGQSIRRAGEDVARGTVVLSKGERLTPASTGLAAGIGLDRLSVSRRPRVAMFSTGDELVTPGTVAPEAMPPGAIYNSNRYFLRALLQRLGCEVTDLGIVPDSRAATLHALRTAAEGHDVIVTSGGVSVGEEDHIKPAVEALGSLDLWQIAVKPGKPFAYGRVANSHFIGLPGNPVSSLVTFLLLVRPFVLRLQGVPAAALDFAAKSIAIPAHFTWAKGDKRREFLRVRRNAAGGVELFTNQSSGVLTSTVWADGLVDNPPGNSIAHGDSVRFIPIAELLN